MGLRARIKEVVGAVEVGCGSDIDGTCRRCDRCDMPLVQPAWRELEDLLAGGIAGLSLRDMRQYLGYVADSRLRRMGIAPAFHAKNPFSFMDLQDVQELTNFFERRVSAYQTAIAGEVGFGEDF